MKVLPWFLRAIWCPKHLTRILKISFLKSLFTCSWISLWVSEFKWYEAGGGGGEGGGGLRGCQKPQTLNLKEMWHPTNQVFCSHLKHPLTTHPFCAIKIDLIFLTIMDSSGHSIRPLDIFLLILLLGVPRVPCLNHSTHSKWRSISFFQWVYYF